MAVKKKNQKKAYSKWLSENSVKIKCCYCDAGETCKFRERKESTEKMGIMTYCAITPNRKKKKSGKETSNANKITCTSPINKVQLNQV